MDEPARVQGSGARRGLPVAEDLVAHSRPDPPYARRHVSIPARTTRSLDGRSFAGGAQRSSGRSGPCPFASALCNGRAPPPWGAFRTESFFKPVESLSSNWGLGGWKEAATYLLCCFQRFLPKYLASRVYESQPLLHASKRGSHHPR